MSAQKLSSHSASRFQKRRQMSCVQAMVASVLHHRSTSAAAMPVGGASSNEELDSCQEAKRHRVGTLVRLTTTSISRLLGIGRTTIEHANTSLIPVGMIL